MSIFVLLALLAGVERGQVSVVLNVHDVGVQEVTVVFESTGAGAAAVRKVLRPGEPASIELPEGNWSLDLVDRPDLWHQREHFFVPPSGTTQVVVDVWPSSSLVGTIAVKASTVPSTGPAELWVRFESLPGPPAGNGPSGELRCPIEQNVFRCSLPAGELDLRLRPPGFIAQSLPRVSLTAGARKVLGTVAFREGQSITGRVQLPAKFAGEVTAVVVSAEPMVAAGGSRDRILTVAAKPEKSGFFHIDGVAPGAYAVRAAYRNVLYSGRIEVEVRPGRKAELTDPVALEHPRHVRLAVSPPLDPRGDRWHVRLSRVVDERRLETAGESSATPEGMWQSSPVQPDRYLVTIGTIHGDVWHEERIDLGEGDFEGGIAISPGGEIHGSVTLGDHPLQASLTFSDPSKFRVTTSSDESGRFRVVAPKGNGSTLDVRVHSDTPAVERRVTVKLPADGESIEIALPGAALTGEVVDAEGIPAGEAILYISGGDPSDPLVQPELDGNGRFEAHGLAPGSYSLIAAGFLTESEPVTVELKDGEVPEPVRLVLRDVQTLRGQVVSSYGGVPGARVHARAVDVHQMMVAAPPANANGEFAIPVPRGARLFDLTVAAPGFSCLIRRVKLGERPVTVDVEQRGGTLVVLADAAAIPWLVHDGGTVPLPTVGHVWPMRTEELPDKAHRFVVPMMDPGFYAACLVDDSQAAAFRSSAGQTAGRCVQGVLAPFGTLTLDARSRERR